MTDYDRIRELEEKIQAAEDREKDAVMKKLIDTLASERSIPVDLVELVAGKNAAETTQKVDRLQRILERQTAATETKKPQTELERLKAQLQDMLDKGVRLEYRLPISRKIHELENKGS